MGQRVALLSFSTSTSYTEKWRHHRSERREEKKKEFQLGNGGRCLDLSQTELSILFPMKKKMKKKEFFFLAVFLVCPVWCCAQHGRTLEFYARVSCDRSWNSTGLCCWLSFAASAAASVSRGTIYYSHTRFSFLLMALYAFFFLLSSPPNLQYGRLKERLPVTNVRFFLVFAKQKKKGGGPAGSRIENFFDVRWLSFRSVWL